MNFINPLLWHHEKLRRMLLLNRCQMYWFSCTFSIFAWLLWWLTVHYGLIYGPDLQIGISFLYFKKMNWFLLFSGSSQTKRQKWNKEEVEAVEKTLLDFIKSGKVPGKALCQKCIETSPQALKDRAWQGVKFYVKNRIDSLKRDSLKRR